MTRLVTADVLTRLGAADAVLGFGGGKIGEAPPSKRTLQLDGTDAFELSSWCGTCPLLFERLAGANRTLSSDELADRLESRLDEIDPDVLRSASEVLPIGDYLPMLLDVSPNLVNPLGSGDYFAEEQVEHRGVDAFWGLPHDARTPYYRAGDRPVNATGHLFEFVVPMVPPSWNDAARVEHYSEVLAAGRQPTALAVAVLDVTQPWDSTQAHWGLTHFLLDGHHKLYAAALGGHSLRLVTLLSVGGSLAAQGQVTTVPAILRGDATS